VWFEGVRIDQLRPHDVVGMGISQSPEGRRVFSRLTVLDNLEMGAYTRTDRAAIKADLAQVFELFPVLEERQNQVAGTLSGGEQQMLSMGRALMAEPQLLLLDEPSMGLAPMLVEVIFQTVQDINRRGTPILLVEQNAAMALSVADRGYVLETGRVALEGTAQEVLEDPQVKAAYLGEI
jgi:branched-chain amino acid transport system ATP-binding protein